MDDTGPYVPSAPIGGMGPAPETIEPRSERWRAGWRQWWKYRREEFDAVAAWVNNHDAIWIGLVVAAVFAGAIALWLALSALKSQACASDCERFGKPESLHRVGTCYCLDGHGHSVKLDDLLRGKR